MDIDAGDLPKILKKYTDEGSRLACLYARDADGGRVLEAILIGKRVERITACVAGGEFESAAPLVPGASLYEREIYETSGLRPVGHPDMRPLRSRTVWSPQSGAAAIPHNGIIGNGTFEIPVGPIHAGVIGPGHFRFSVAGEPILMMRTYLGYSRRGVEKLMETSASADNTLAAERISGDNAVAHTLAYLQTVEQDSEIPARAEYIRTIYAELERIYNHLGTIAGIALDSALAVPASQGSMLRESMLRLNESVSGHRLLWGALRPGGLSRDLSAAALGEIERKVMTLTFDVEDLLGVMTRSPSFMDRAETTGKLSYEDALRTCAVGPVARASGVDYDVRKAFPYAAYGRTALSVPKCPSGDVYARLTVRKNEIAESVSIILQCINDMKDGPVRTKTEPKDGFHIGMAESPRGEVVHCAHIENGKVARCKIRDASFPNWPALECAVLGNIVPDFPIVNKSFDLSYSGNDL
ncbi:MAG: NADH-quinone oxidoreductase subunit C [Candidatus Methanoplasma sp.]|jgi:Ni,Fe-hydrogenase III large subunit|nr:NADH-quinone oxidoreductase subunit C [Candidatus Methanoplasma sp.]